MNHDADSEHHVVTVWDRASHPQHELSFRHAEGFVHAAIAILEEQRNADQADYFNIAPAYFALEHGIELFLKGAILLGDSSIAPEVLASKELGHNLQRLYDRYLEIFVDDRYRMYHRIGEIIDWRATTNDPGGFALRYPFDRGGSLYGPGNLMIDVDLVLEISREFLDDLGRLEQAVKEAQGVRSCAIEQFRYRRE